MKRFVMRRRYADGSEEEVAVEGSERTIFRVGNRSITIEKPINEFSEIDDIIDEFRDLHAELNRLLVEEAPGTTTLFFEERKPKLFSKIRRALPLPRPRSR